MTIDLNAHSWRPMLECFALARPVCWLDWTTTRYPAPVRALL